MGYMTRFQNWLVRPYFSEWVASPLYQVVLEALFPQVLHQVGPVLPGESQAELTHGLVSQLPFLQISVTDLPVRAAQLEIEKLRRCLVDLQEPGSPALPLSALLGVILLGERHAGPLRQHPYGLRERIVLVVHHEGVDIPSSAAAEAVIHLHVAVDGKRGGLLIVEGAEAPIAAALFLEPHVAPYHFHDVVPCPDLFHNLFCVVHPHLPVRPSGPETPSAPQPIQDFGMYMSS